MGKGLKCQICKRSMYADKEDYQDKGTWVTYVCNNNDCENYKKSGQRFREKTFESN